MDLINGRFCPVNGETMESPCQFGRHLIGDAAIAPGLPKSMCSADTQAQRVAMQANRLQSGQYLVAPICSNVCFGRVSAEHGALIANMVRFDRAANKTTKTEDTGGAVPVDAAHQVTRKKNFKIDWFG